VRRGSDVNWRPAARGRVHIRRWAVGFASAAIAVGVIGLGLWTPRGDRGNAAPSAGVETIGSAERIEPVRILNRGAAERQRPGEPGARRQNATVGHESPPPRMQPPPRRGPADY